MAIFPSANLLGVIGIVSLYSKEEREFSQGEIELIKAFADQAAINIENARLYERAKARRSSIRRPICWALSRTKCKER